MSETDSMSTAKWFWTDELARLLADSGKPLVPPLDQWLQVPFAVRGAGDPIAVAEALLAGEGTVAA
ncbi:MAG: hypothetical protein ACR2ME_01515 [Acidimicrobiia bacterium]